MIGSKQRDDRAGKCGLAAKCIDHRGQAIGHPGLAQIAEQRPEQDQITRTKVSRYQEFVKAVIFGNTCNRGRNCRLDDFGTGKDIDRAPLRHVEHEAVHMTELAG